MTIQSRTCPKCGLELEIDCFGVDRSKPDGRMTVCRPCASARSLAYYYANREHVRRYQNEHRRLRREAAA